MLIPAAMILRKATDKVRNMKEETKQNIISIIISILGIITIIGVGFTINTGKSLKVNETMIPHDHCLTLIECNPIGFWALNGLLVCIVIGVLIHGRYGGNMKKRNTRGKGRREKGAC